MNRRPGTIVLISLLMQTTLPPAKGVFLGHTASKQNLQQDFNEFVGERVVVKTAITPKAGRRVELHGTSWQAEAEMEIPEGTIVEITAKENITLKVKPL